MIDRNSGLGWTDAQWNQVRQAVADEWQRARVAGSLLPSYGPLPASTAVVPSEVLEPNGTIDVAATARIMELSAKVELSSQQVNEDDLSDATLLFTRAAAALAREEDRVVFNGQQPPRTYLPGIAAAVRPTTRFPDVTRSGGEPDIEEILTPQLTLHRVDLLSTGLKHPKIAGLERKTPLRALLLTNPGAAGLVFVSNSVRNTLSLNPEPLVQSVVDAISDLDSAGYGPPFACFFSQRAFVAAHTPIRGSLVLPSDRIEPLLGQPIVRASVLDEEPRYEGHTGRGLILSLAGGALDLAIAAEAAPTFVQINEKGGYVFRVAERFALRVKDPNAIVRLEFQ